MCNQSMKKYSTRQIEVVDSPPVFQASLYQNKSANAGLPNCYKINKWLQASTIVSENEYTKFVSTKHVKHVKYTIIVVFLCE